MRKGRANSALGRGQGPSRWSASRAFAGERVEDRAGRPGWFRGGGKGAGVLRAMGFPSLLPCRFRVRRFPGGCWQGLPFSGRLSCSHTSLPFEAGPDSASPVFPSCSCSGKEKSKHVLQVRRPGHPAALGLVQAPSSRVGESLYGKGGRWQPPPTFLEQRVLKLREALQG